MSRKQHLSFFVKVNALFGLILFFVPSIMQAVCARVTIQIKQELTLERQAFIAHMRINNGTTMDLNNIGIDVLFSDKDGNPVIATGDPSNPSPNVRFFIRHDSSENITHTVAANYKIQGGKIIGNTTADLYWMIIPGYNAAQGQKTGVIYYVGAKLNYLLGGKEEEVNISPDYIWVKPMPKIQLDYFLPQSVYGEIPYSLGVRVKNNGVGPAQKVGIESAQPQIKDNPQGLLINFKIIGSEVQGIPGPSSLLVYFGDIPSQQLRLARWWMVSTLSGSNVEFTASISHADELGGKVTSLIDPVDLKTHWLIGDVLVDLPGRDQVRDFLARKEKGDFYYIYESDTVESLVENRSSGTQLSLTGDMGLTRKYRLQVPMPQPGQNGFMIVMLNSPIDFDSWIVEKVERSDLKILPAGNAWLSKVMNTSNGSFIHFLNVFDFNPSAFEYSIMVKNKAGLPQPPVLDYIPDYRVTGEEELGFIVTCVDPDSGSVSLTAAPLPGGAEFTDQKNKTGRFHWVPSVGQSGSYQLVVKASDGWLQDSQVVHIQVCPADDRDCDGMKDQWELTHFGTLDRDGSGDWDNDGISDLEEYKNGLNPKVNNNVPGLPRIEYPPVGGVIGNASPELSFVLGIDPDGDSIVHVLELYADRLLTQLVFQKEFNGGSGVIHCPVPDPLQENRHYYWRVKAADGHGSTRWVYGDFIVNAVNETPGVCVLAYPATGTSVSTVVPLLQVNNSVDPDGEGLSYRFEVHADQDLSTLVKSSPLIAAGEQGMTAWQVSLPLNDGETYYWRVQVLDSMGNYVFSPLSSFTVDLSNPAPPAPVIAAPLREAGLAEVSAADVVLEVLNSSDPQGQPLQYYFEIDHVQTFDSAQRKESGWLEPGVERTGWTVAGLCENSVYFWRCKVSDGQAESAWVTGQFRFNGLNEQPAAPVIINPAFGAWVSADNQTIALETVAMNDPDGDDLLYIFEIYQDQEMQKSIAAKSQPASTYQWNFAESGQAKYRYYWRVKVQDSHGLSSAWSPLQEFFIRPGWENDPPTISITQPSQDIFTTGDSLDIQWQDSDPDSNATISLYYDTDTQGQDGTLIAAGLREDDDGPEGFYSWDIRSLQGRYYIYAIIADQDHNMISYCPFSVTIDHTLPVIKVDPVGGTYPHPLWVRLSCNKTADIHFTLDGTVPTISSPKYETALAISQTVTLQCLAKDSAGLFSEIKSETYTIQVGDQVAIQVQTEKHQGLPGLPVNVFNADGSAAGIAPVNTNALGIALFDKSLFAAGQDYQFKVNYLGYSFASELLNVPAQLIGTVTIATEQVVVTLTINGQPLPGYLVKVLSSDLAFTGLSKTTNTEGIVIFELPVGKSFSFASQYQIGEQISGSILVVAGGPNSFAFNLLGGTVQLTVLKDGLMIPDPNEKYIPGVTVSLYNPANVFLGMQKITDLQGMASFAVPAGDYRFKVDYLGYAYWTVVFSLTKGASQQELRIPHALKRLRVKSRYQQQITPVSGLYVTVHTLTQDPPVWEKQTDGSGIVEFFLPQKKKYRLLTKYLNSPKWISLGTAEEVSVEYELAEAQVSLTWGAAPLKNVDVEAWHAAGDFTGLVLGSGESGQVTFRLPPGDYIFKTFYQQRYISSDPEMLIVHEINPVSFHTGGDSFRFKVQKSVAEPLAELKCYVFDEEKTYLNISGKTDSTGETSFNLAHGEYYFRIDYLGYSFWSEKTILPSSGAVIYTIPHQSVKVSVLGLYAGAQNGISGAQVSLFTELGKPLLTPQLTGSTGQSDWLLPGRRYRFEVKYQGQSYGTDPLQWEDATVLIALAKARVKVQNGSTPLVGKTVSVWLPDFSPVTANGETDGNGQVVFTLPQASYRFQVNDANANFSSEAIPLLADQETDVAISTGGLAFVFNLYKGVADPLAKAHCYLYDDQGNYQGQQGLTNSDGVVGFAFSSGRYKIRVDYLGYSFYSELIIAPQDTQKSLLLPHSDIKITVNRRFQDLTEHLAGQRIDLLTGQSVETGLNQLTDVNGQAFFSVPGQVFQGRVQYLGQRFWSGSLSSAAGTITVPLGRMRLLIKENGAPVAGKVVRLFSADSAYLQLETLSGTDGYAGFLLPAGTYRFCVEQQAGEVTKQNWTGVITIVADQLIEKELLIGN